MISSSVDSDGFEVKCDKEYEQILILCIQNYSLKHL